MDTIFALATARGKAGVAIVRLSGPGAFKAAVSLCASLPQRRRAAVRLLRSGEAVLDQALVLSFDAGQSFTGEDVVEFHLHGSVAVIQAVLKELSHLDGLRLAEPGEFTRRALENGMLDLTQVEGLSDLIEAETEAQRRQALRVLSGAIGQRAEIWRKTLVRIAALIEATIDFADEDVPVDVSPEVSSLMATLLDALRNEVRAARSAERVRAGFEVAIIGQPNVGKSTLLNALAGREAAITSEFAGTTRDVIEVRMDVDGLPVILLDTAGLRETTDPVERKGIDLAVRRAEAADLRVYLLESADEAAAITLRPGDLRVVSKADQTKNWEGLSVSGLSGQGIDALLTAISAELGTRIPIDGVMTRERHIAAMRSAIEALESAQIEVTGGMQLAEVAAADVRRAIAAMDVLVGRLGVEDFLAEIFSSFCIGK